MNYNRIANEITSELLKNGFVVHRYNSKSTNSIYLKLDYGVCCGIRIADHKGKQKYHYKFNVFKDYKGDRVIKRDNLVSYFYTFEEISQLINKIQEEKQQKIKKYGIYIYKRIMESESNENNLFIRFKQVV